MDKRIKIDDRLASFYDKLYADDSTVEACKGRVAEALAEMADSLRLGRMELTLDSPVSALRPSGAYQTNVLYDRKDGTVCEECFYGCTRFRTEDRCGASGIRTARRLFRKKNRKYCI